MAGPRVRGDLGVLRNVQARKVRQGSRTFTPTGSISAIQLTAGDPYSLIINARNPVTAVSVTLPPVSSASSIDSAVSGGTLSVPIGPAAGVGTEFSITNLSGTTTSVAISSAGNALVGGIPNGNTAIFTCTAVTEIGGVDIGTWRAYVTDASSASLTPVNITFDANIGVAASGSVSIGGTSLTSASTITVSFTNAGGDPTYTATTASLPITTTAAAATSAMVTALNNDLSFAEFYTAAVNGTTNTQIDITAIDNGTRYNSTTVTIAFGTATPGLTGTNGSLISGANGSWTSDGETSFFKIAGVRHNRGLDPVFNTYENVTPATVPPTRSEVLIESVTTPSTGEIRIVVNSSPLGTFAGSVDIL